MSDSVFVDTNVLVYSRDASESKKQPRTLSWMKHLWENRTGWLSFQVLQEFYVTSVFKLDPGLDAESARQDVRGLLSWRPLPVDARVLEGAWVVRDQYRLSWWDALIVASAQAMDCRFLLTEDLQADQDFGGLRVLNPFVISPRAPPL